MAKAHCDCLCSYNHPEQLGRCTGHNYRTMIVGVRRPDDPHPALCPKCRTVLHGTALAPLRRRAPV